MRPKILVFTLVILCSALFADSFPVPKLPFAPKIYPCFRANGALEIDGRIGDTAWELAPWTDGFTDIEGELKPAPFHDTRVKMLWDDEGIYFAARIEEPQIWAKLTDHDSVIFYDNDFEIFIDPDGDTHQYFELELNAFGTLWDLFLLKPYRDEHSSLNGWEAAGIKLAIGIDGTLNDPSDIDKAWYAEVFLPWEAVKELAHKACPPNPGDWWRVNFSRVHWDTEIIDGEYVKIPGKPEYNWVWSPQGLINMHYPECWGLVFFLEKAEDLPKEGLSLPQILLAEEYLRQLYYAQKQHWMDHGRYSQSLAELGLEPFVFEGAKYIPRLETTSASFLANLETDIFPTLRISENGRLRRLEKH